MKKQKGLIKRIMVTVTDQGDGMAIIHKETFGFNTLELVGLYTELLEELKLEILSKRNKEEKLK